MAPRTRRRTTPGSVLEDFPETPAIIEDVIDEPVEDRRKKLAIFDYMRTLTPSECEQHIVYLYRLDPKIQNAAGQSKYIQKYSVPLDEEQIKQDHGGGKYELKLNLCEPGKQSVLIKNAFFSVDGPAKIPAGTIVLNGDTGQVVPPGTPAAAATPAAENSAIKEVLQMLGKVLEDQNKGGDFNTEILKKTLMDSHDIMAEAMKKSATSITGNPLLDGLLQNQLANLAKPVDPLAQLKMQMDLMKSMRELVGAPEERAPRGDSFLDRAKGIAELLKTDTTGELRGLIFPQEAEPAGLGASLFKIAEKVISQRPDIIDSAANLLKRMSGSTVAEHQPGPAPPVLGAPAQPQVIQPQQQQQSEAAQPQTQEVALINGLLGVVKNGFTGGYDGSMVAASLRVAHPNEAQMLLQYMGLPDDAILGWLRSQPVIAPIMTDPRFAEFFQDFKAELTDPTPLDAEPGEEEQAEAAGAGS
jgi:hypothetical protein